MNRLAKTNLKIQVICVYLAEAHACDEWPLGNFECVRKAKTQQERLDIARYFVDKYDLQVPVLVDNMENVFDNAYGAWPERWYLLSKTLHTFEEIGYPSTEFGYDRSSLETIVQQIERRTD